jgi:hypothetical protein
MAAEELKGQSEQGTARIGNRLRQLGTGVSNLVQALVWDARGRAISALRKPRTPLSERRHLDGAALSITLTSETTA